MTESEKVSISMSVSSLSEEEEPVTEEHRAILKAEKAALQALSGNYGDIAYQLLLLQQRLEAYERLHQEEVAELRRDLDQLRRTFLETTNPQLRAIKRTAEQPEQK
jgi:phage shock protein A